MAKKEYPLVFHGVELKLEPGLLQDGQFQSAQNVTSIQEGGLSPRLGTRQLVGTQNPTLVHSMHKLILGGPDSNNPRYLGDQGLIWRVKSPLTSGIYQNVTSGLGINNSKWEAECYNPGDGSAPTLFVASNSKMLRDDGSYNVLLPWGIIPALEPTILIPGSPTIELGDDSGSVARLATPTVSGATAISTDPAGSGMTYYNVFPSTMVGITAGMLVTFTGGGGATCIVDNTFWDPTGTTGSFFVWSNVVPSGTIASGAHSYTQIADGSTFTPTPISSVTNDWSFGATSDANGYSSDDVVHFSINISDIANVASVSFVVYVNGSTTDFYQYQVPLTTVGSGAWSEFGVPKSLFVPVGQAGSGAYGWNNVTALSATFVMNTVSGTPSTTLLLGNIYAVGGGGPDSLTIPTAAPYDYIYTFRNPLTGEEGNPSQGLIPASKIDVQGRSVLVKCFGCFQDAVAGNPLISGFGSISVYRAGGVFADDIYRFVGYATNPGVDSSGNILSVVFVDNQSDANIINNPSVEFDNYPPVPSNLKNPLATVTTIDLAPGLTIIPLDMSKVNASDLRSILTVGSEITIGTLGNQETVTIASVSSNLVTGVVQYAHPAGDQVTCDFIVNQPCDVLCQAGDAILLAGDANNPHIVYRSKNGQVAQFPVINLETGNAHTQIIGSPDNGVNGLVDWGGTYVSLNAENIWTFQLWLGAFINVTKSPADHGMVAKHLWAKVNNEIWYVSYDGIYRWAGSGCVKATESIDGLFRGQSVNGYNPVDYTQIASAQLTYWQNTVWFIYIDTSGARVSWRFDTVFNRWEYYSTATFGTSGGITCMLTEEDTYNLLGTFYNSGTQRSQLAVMENGTSDFNTPIVWNGKTGWYAPEGRSVNKQFTDILIEVLNPSDTITVSLYYDYAATADVSDTFVIPASANRRWVPIPLQQSLASTFGKEARVVSFRFSGSSSSAVTLYSVAFSYIPLAELQRGRITDWTDLGYPYDKKLVTMVIDYNTYGNTLTMQLDTISGLNGNTITDGVQAFTLTGVGRAQVSLPLNDGIVVKKVRLRPSGPLTSSPAIANLDYEVFGWDFPGFIKYPADVVLFTEWTDGGYPCEKVFRGFEIEMNTGGVPCVVQSQVDGQEASSTTVITTDSDRGRIITIPTNATDPIIGKMARLTLSPGAGGYAQLFKGPTWDFWREPCARMYLDTDELNLGTQSFKLIKQMWVEYRAAAGMIIQVYVSGKLLFTTQALPAQNTRDVARFFLPDENNGVYNKSKIYSFIFLSADGMTPFYLYEQSCRVESLDLSGDQRASYRQFPLFQETRPLAQ